MALSTDERDALLELKQKGYNFNEAMGFIASTRLGSTSRVENDYLNPQQEPEKDDFLSDIGRGVKGIGNAWNTMLSRSDAASQRNSLIGKTTGKLAAGTRFFGDTASSVFDAGIRALPGGSTAMNALEQGIGRGVQRVATSPTAQKIGQAYGELPEPVKMGLRDVGNITQGSFDALSVAAIPSGARAIATGFDKAVASFAETGIKEAGEAGIRTASRMGLAPEDIMQRVARITKGKQAAFEERAGESVGEYLVNRGIFGDPEQIAEQLYTRMQTSMSRVDAGLAKVQGTYKNGTVSDALEQLLERELKVSSPNTPSRDLSRVQKLIELQNGKGLSLQEINEVKRLYERNVKLDYLRDNVSDGIARANTVDSALREFVVDEAAKHGFKNVKQLNMETTLAKQLMDDLGAEFAGQAGNNFISLSDAFFLAEAANNPTALLAFGLKKTLSSRGVMSSVAKLINGKNARIGMPEAQFDDLLQLPAPAEGAANASNRVPINLQSQTQSARDILEGQNPNIKTTSPGYQQRGEVPVRGAGGDGNIQIRDNANQYYPPNSELPVIDMGSGRRPSSGLTDIQSAAAITGGAGAAYYLSNDKDSNLAPLFLAIGMAVPAAGTARKEVVKGVMEYANNKVLKTMSDFKKLDDAGAFVTNNKGEMIFHDALGMSKEEVENVWDAGMGFVEKFDEGVTHSVSNATKAEMNRLFTDVLNEVKRLDFRKGANPAQLGNEAVSAAEAGLLEQARGFDNANSFIEAVKSRILLHGGPSELKGGKLQLGRGIGGQDAGGIFFAENIPDGMNYARGYTLKGDNYEGSIHQAILKPDAKIFDFTNPVHRELLKKNVSQQEYNLYVETGNGGHFDWAQTPDPDLIERLGFDGMKVRERSAGFKVFDENYKQVPSKNDIIAVQVFNEKAFDMLPKEINLGDIWKASQLEKQGKVALNGTSLTPKQSGTLVVVHNASAAKLDKVNKVGGLANPSMAVINPEVSGFTNFGDITFIANKDILSSKGARTFAADIYSPRYPNTVTTVDYKKLHNVEKERGIDLSKVDTEDFYSSAENSSEVMRAFLGREGKRNGDDKSALREAIAPVMDDYLAFVDELAADVGVKEKIFKGFTYSGRRRYADATLENASKDMRAQDMRGGETFFYGLGSLRSKVAPKLSNVSAIKKIEDRIMSPAEFEKAKLKYEAMFDSLSTELAKHKKYKDSNPFIDADNTGVLIGEYLAGDKTVLKDAFENVPDSVVQKIETFRNELMTMPTAYFETKFSRPVYLDEFSVAVIPEDTPQRTINILKERGVPTVTYKKGEGEQMKAVLRYARENGLMFGIAGLGVYGVSGQSE